MSQHTFSRNFEGHCFQVQMGWDKPLQWFYCVIILDGNEDEPYYSNLDEATPHDLYYYAQICDRLGLDLPSGIIEEILCDQRSNVVGRKVDWDRAEDLNWPIC